MIAVYHLACGMANNEGLIKVRGGGEGERLSSEFRTYVSAAFTTSRSPAALRTIGVV